MAQRSRIGLFSPLSNRNISPLNTKKKIMSREVQRKSLQEKSSVMIKEADLSSLLESERKELTENDETR